MKLIILTLIPFIVMMGSFAKTQELQPIKLLTPSLTNDKPLMQALKERQSRREFDDRELSLQDLANVLWCANGVNREDGRRTAPSAMNRQDIDVYVFLKTGIYLYDAPKHELTPIVAGDFRIEAGLQEYVATAPLNLVFVSDLAKFGTARQPEDKIWMSGIDAGHCSQNVYLYCAAAELAVVTRMSIDREKLCERLKLRPEQIPVLAETVGYPKPAAEQK
jgi:SagB-type dehydrogenase family enzyme